MQKKLPSTAMNKIRQMDGAEGMKAFAEKLYEAANNRSRLLKHFSPPNLLLLANEGAGVTHCLTLLTELLHDLLPVNAFIGEEDLFEWCIQDDDESFKHLLLRVRQAGGFYGQFRGVIGLDMRPMLAEEVILPEMRRLMTFVREQQDVIFVFVAPLNMSPILRKALEEELTANTMLETVELHMPDKETAADYILSQLHRRGFLAGNDVCEAARNAAAQLIAAKGFAGFRSLDTLVAEVAWRKPFPAQAWKPARRSPLPGSGKSALVRTDKEAGLWNRATSTARKWRSSAEPAGPGRTR